MNDLPAVTQPVPTTAIHQTNPSNDATPESRPRNEDTTRRPATVPEMHTKRPRRRADVLRRTLQRRRLRALGAESWTVTFCAGRPTGIGRDPGPRSSHQPLDCSGFLRPCRPLSGRASPAVWDLLGELLHARGLEGGSCGPPGEAAVGGLHVGRRAGRVVRCLCVSAPTRHRGSRPRCRRPQRARRAKRRGFRRLPVLRRRTG